jgi:hypothetical protein
MRRTTLLVVCTLALALCASYAAASEGGPPPDTLKIDYFANANTAGAPDATVRLTNPGSAGGGVCANIYVFDSFQEMSECCSCYISPDGLRTISVNTNLTSNPLTGVTLNTGAIKIVSNVATSTYCPVPTKANTIFGGVRAWATHIQNSNFTVTETASQDATLSNAEVSRLNAECSAISLDGSGKGICSCGTGD